MLHTILPIFGRGGHRVSRAKQGDRAKRNSGEFRYRSLPFQPALSIWSLPRNCDFHLGRECQLGIATALECFHHDANRAGEITLIK
jgi:hypothetical protein